MSEKKHPPTTIDDVCDFIISEVTEGGTPLNLLKLQKLIYYCDAWYLAFDKGPLFEEKFQAWVHGPVSRRVYDRFVETKDLYSPVTISDLRPGFNPNSLTPAIRGHIKSVLEVYNKFTGSQLEEMTHREDPWIITRKGLAPAERCEKEIDKTLIKTFYASRLKKK